MRYPGGKRRLVEFIQLIIEKKGIIGGTYAEPFAGGAAVALSLLLEGTVQKIFINDKSLAIYSFWYSVLNHTEELSRLIYDTAVTVEEWQRQREILETVKKPCLELGFATFFMNRTNRSGILRGGIIGGKNQAGPWKLDARFNKKELIKRICSIAEKKNKIELYNLDIFDFINQVVPALNISTLIYFDPPYFKKGSMLYENHFNETTHKKLAEVITKKIKLPWIVSYDNVDKIKEFYSGHEMAEFSLSYSAAKRYKGTEIMIFCEPSMRPNQQEMKKYKVRIKLV